MGLTAHLLRTARKPRISVPPPRFVYGRPALPFSAKPLKWYFKYRLMGLCCVMISQKRHLWQLLLTEATSPSQVEEDGREQAIREVVETFYLSVRDDPILGPVFNTHVADWDKHLATMCDFWSAAVYRTGRYKGRPLEVHRRIPKLSLSQFDRWLELWGVTARATAKESLANHLISLAQRMGNTMTRQLTIQSRING